MRTNNTENAAYADEDRLPWLESADEDYREGPSAMRVILLAVIGLLVIAAVIFGYRHFRAQRGPAGSGELIRAPDGDYKIKPDEPGGMKVEGEGDTVFSASEGGASNGAINAGAVPEAPVDGKAARPVPKSGPGTATVVAAVPAKGGKLTAQAPAILAPRAAAGGGGGSLVQLGSFPSEAAANTAWSETSKRFTYLAPLGKSVERAEVAGRTVYRLRVDAGSAVQASSICGKLKVAGEACFIPN